MNRDVDVIHEAFVLWPAWTVLVEYVSRVDPRESDPHSIYGSLMAIPHDRLCALLFAHASVESMDEASDLLDDLLLFARSGVRPRFGLEVGLGPFSDVDPIEEFVSAPVEPESHRRDSAIQALAAVSAGVAVALLMRGRRS